MMKGSLQRQTIQGESDEAFGDDILARLPIGAHINISVSSLVYQFPGSQNPLQAKAIIFAPPHREPRAKPSSQDSLFAATRFLFGSHSKIDKQELLQRHRPFTVYVALDLNNIDIKENP